MLKSFKYFLSIGICIAIGVLAHRFLIDPDYKIDAIAICRDLGETKLLVRDHIWGYDYRPGDGGSSRYIFYNVDNTKTVVLAGLNTSCVIYDNSDLIKSFEVQKHSQDE